MSRASDTKGNRLTQDTFTNFVLEQLEGLGGLTCKSMFGGFGLYRGSTFFGVIYKGQLFFKTDASTREDYLALGMAHFQPNPRQQIRSYYEVPGDVLENPAELTRWAIKALGAAATR